MAKNLICSTLNSRAVFDIEFQEHLKAKEIRKYLIAFIIFPPTFSDGAVSGTISMFSHLLAFSETYYLLFNSTLTRCESQAR